MLNNIYFIIRKINNLISSLLNLTESLLKKYVLVTIEYQTKH